MRRFATTLLLCLMIVGPAAATAKRVTVTGEVIDSWCYITQIMYPEGTAHHQCALWCAAGGIPVGIVDKDGVVYMVLKMEQDTTSVANPAVLRIQTHKVTVDGDLSDWDIVPIDPYTVRNDRLYSPVAEIQPVGRGEVDASDINIRHLLSNIVLMRHL